jgi:hypothetical protein
MARNDNSTTRSQRRPKQEKENMKTKLTKTIMSSLSFTCALGCLVAAIAVGTSATGGPAPDPAAAEEASNGHACSVHNLRGVYVWAWDGYANFGGNLVPKAVLQGLRFNGDGTTYNTFGTVNIGGTTIIDGTGAVGTYTVAADCTGTLSITGGPSFNMYVGPGAEQLWITQVAGGNGTGPGLGVGMATRVR